MLCSVCSEVFIDAKTINCGHTFCSYCIYRWKHQKSNCPVCRTEIKHWVAVQTLDQFVDKMYDQFVSEGGQAARTSLKNERLKQILEYYSRITGSPGDPFNITTIP